MADLPGGIASPLIDTHAHLADARLAGDLDAVLARARAAGVRAVIVPATTADDAAAGVALAEEHPGEVYAAVAIHPNHGAEAKAGDFDRIVELASRPEVVAIGETGLDRYWKYTPFDLQQELFDRHLALARRTGKPVVVHVRDCYAETIDQLRRQGGPVRGVLHSFTGTADDAAALLDLGMHLSFAGMITFANKGLDPLREVAARVPADRLLVETDSPYLSPHPFRGKPNEPSRVALVAATVARVRGLDLATLAALTTSNAVALFGLPARLSHLA
jgi:TatD DNase family protein